MSNDISHVIKGIECHMFATPRCEECPYDDIDLRCIIKLRRDILTVLDVEDSDSCTLCQEWDCDLCGHKGRRRVVQHEID